MLEKKPFEGKGKIVFLLNVIQRLRKTRIRTSACTVKGAEVYAPADPAVANTGRALNRSGGQTFFK